MPHRENDLRYNTRSPRKEMGREKQDLRQSISERRALLSKNVWKRLDNGNDGNYPRDRERYHPYKTRREISSYRTESYRTERQKSPLEWRPKSSNDHHRDQLHRRSKTENSYRRNRSPSDSQRTVSDNFGAVKDIDRSLDKGYERRYQLSRQKDDQAGREWRPVHRSTEPSAERASERVSDRVSDKSEKTETEEERIRRIKGKDKGNRR